MTRWIVSGLLALPLAAPLAGQAASGVARVVQEAMGTRYAQPECKVEGGDFRVSSGKTYLKTGTEATDPEKRMAALRNGVRVITEAMTTSGQAGSSAAWYYLGRLSLQMGDLAGADTVFAKAETLAPGCKADIRKYRHRAWAALVTPGNVLNTANQADSALIMYRAANLILRDLPSAFAGMADIFAAQGRNDSAAVYYELAGATEPTEPGMVKLRDQARFNHGVTLLNTNHPREAAAAFQRYLSAVPDDIDALKGLSQAFRKAGMADSASAVEQRLVGGGGAGGDQDAVEGLSENDLVDIAVRQFRDKSYREAAATFGRALAINPLNQIALFDQANCYLALQEGPNLAAAAERLLQLEPLHEFVHSMRIQGYKLAGKKEALFAAVVDREATLVNLEMSGFQVSPDGASIVGKATGREARTQDNALLPPKALILVVEFLAKGGAAVASQEIPLPALKPGETTEIQAAVKGNGIVGWRYRVKK